MSLNTNNFLRWTGSFLPTPFTLHSDPVLDATLFSNQKSVYCTPIALLYSTNGLDASTFDIIGISTPLASPPEWNIDTLTLTTFRPLDILITSYTISFTIRDFLGNITSTINQLIIVSPIVTTWLTYPTSAVCLLDAFGNNTGYQNFTQLVLANMADDSYILPLQLEDNIPSNPNYIPPVQNFVSCPAPGAGSGIYAGLVISNFTKNASDLGNFIRITSIYLSSSNMGPGSTPFAQLIPCDIPPGTSARFNVPAVSMGFSYDGGITISYEVTGNIETATPSRYWKMQNAGVVTGFGNGGSGINDNLVDNSGALSFIPLPTSIPGVNGIVVFAQ